MDNSPSHNIFDEASKKRSAPPIKKNQQKPADDIFQKPGVPHDPPHLLTETDIQIMFNRVSEMQKDLDKKTDDLKEKISLSPKDVVNFFSEAKNFTPEQWNIIQNNRSDLEKKTWAVIGKDPAVHKEKKLEDKNTKQRKAKSIGARNNWIPMR
jgi:hypothetical protein